MKANYRKLNDGSLSSSTYHKKDGTPVRAMLKRDLLDEQRLVLAYVKECKLINIAESEPSHRVLEYFEECQAASASLALEKVVEALQWDLAERRERWAAADALKTSFVREEVLARYLQDRAVREQAELSSLSVYDR